METYVLVMFCMYIIQLTITIGQMWWRKKFNLWMYFMTIWSIIFMIWTGSLLWL